MQFQLKFMNLGKAELDKHVYTDFGKQICLNLVDSLKVAALILLVAAAFPFTRH